jgi:hypothetical protein
MGNPVPDGRDRSLVDRGIISDVRSFREAGSCVVHCGSEKTLFSAAQKSKLIFYKYSRLFMWQNRHLHKK